MLQPEQLFAERFGVHKVREVEHAIPHNTVTAHMTHQMTGSWATRHLRWDELITTEEPFEVAIGNGKIRVELAALAGEKGRPTYKYEISDPSERVSFASAGLVPEGDATPGRLRPDKRKRQALWCMSSTPLGLTR
jgi:hypothetical protein